MPLTCAAKWCDTCPTGWRTGAVCIRADEILGAAEAYESQAQAALDAYDLAYPEDFLLRSQENT